ncbi:MAG: SAM-dependent methyltransferase [Parabacteroides merdae]
MAFFDRYGMSYHITPGISSFQAAAAALRSQFTIPEKVQTIILTPVAKDVPPLPEKEQLHELAASQSTMCIFLSAGIAGQVQKELLEHYPPTTPVAACYKGSLLGRRTHLPRRIERPGTDRKRKQSDTDDLVSRR